MGWVGGLNIQLRWEKITLSMGLTAFEAVTESMATKTYTANKKLRSKNESH
jgi:hypothetical protein